MNQVKHPNWLTQIME